MDVLSKIWSMLNPGESSNHRSQFEREDLVPTLVVHFTTDKPWLIDMHTQGTPANEHLKGVLAQCGFVRVIWGPDVLTEKIGQSEQYTQIVVVMLDKAPIPTHATSRMWMLQFTQLMER